MMPRANSSSVDPPNLPPGTMPDAFVSYSRRDKAFVQQLYQAFQSRDRDVWVDWQNIQPTEKWWTAIQMGIEAAHAFVFVLSPDSASSEVCGWEIDHALKHNKRLVPIVHRDVDPRQVHEAIGAHNWIFLREGDDFEAGFQALLRAIETDLDYVHQHTRILMKALEWERAHRDPSFLLRGKDLVLSETWLQQGETQIPPPTELHRQFITTSRKAPGYRPTWRTIGLTSAAVMLAIGGVRVTGLLQSLELMAFDQGLRLRLPEPPDSRLLIVEVTENDIQAQLQRNENSKGTVSDLTLERVLTTLEQYQPRLIGIDLYRDFKVDPQVPKLAQHFRQDDRIISLCKVPQTNDQGVEEDAGVKPPPEVPAQRVGFADFALDPGGVVRRQILTQSPIDGAGCSTSQAFSLLLARRYLEQVGGDRYAYRNPLVTHQLPAFGSVQFPRLAPFSSGYQGVDTSGYQVLLNYRSVAGSNPSEQVRDFAQHVTVEDVLNHRISAKDVRDRVVLLGVTATASRNDYFSSPYGTVAGVVVQGQMVSQILSAVLDGRPLLTTWPLLGDVLWILAWSWVGGAVVYFVRSSVPRLLLGGLVLGSIVGCYLVFLWVGHVWITVIPPAIAATLTGWGSVYITIRQHHARVRSNTP